MSKIVPSVTAILVAASITFGGISGGIVGQRMNADAHAAQVAAWTVAIEADGVRQVAAFDQFVAADTAFRDNTVTPALTLIDTATGKASGASLQSLRDAIATYVIPDTDARGATLLREQVRAEAVAGPAIATASEAVVAEVAAWQVAEDARLAAEAEAARAAAEAAAAAEAQRSVAAPSDERSTSSESSPSAPSESAQPQTQPQASGGGFDPRAAVEGAGCSFEWTDSGTSKGGGGAGGGCWVRISTSLSGDRLWMTTWHEVAHGRLFSQSHACNDAQKSVGIELSAQWWTNTYQGFTVPQYGYPNDEGVALLAANCGW